MPTAATRVKATSGRRGVPTNGKPASPLDEIYARPGFLLRRAHQIAVGIFLDECARFNLTPPQHSVLAALARCDRMNQTELAQALGFDRATVGQIVALLEERGFVHRQASVQDRRRKVIKLSPRGSAVLKQAAAALSRTSERILAPLQADQRAVFMSLLLQLTSQLNFESRTPLEAPTTADDV